MLEIGGPQVALLDDPLALRARGAGVGERLLWHARMRDDDGLVWRARADRPEELAVAWRGKRTRAALASLRPIGLDVRVEAPDGRAATRTLTRLVTAEGVRVRRWRDDLRASLYLPAGAAVATVLVDAREDSGGSDVAAPLLASRGVLTLVVSAGDAAAARERLAAVPGAMEPVVLNGPAVPTPAGIPGGEPDRWSGLLHELRARIP